MKLNALLLICLLSAPCAALAQQAGPQVGGGFIMAPPQTVREGDVLPFAGGWRAQYLGQSRWVIVGRDAPAFRPPGHRRQVSPSGQAAGARSKTTANNRCAEYEVWVKPHFDENEFVTGHCEHRNSAYITTEPRRRTRYRMPD